jgi:hypothetical protein
MPVPAESSPELTGDIELSIEQAALLISEAREVWETMVERGVADRRESEPLPRGIFRCGQAMRLIPTLALLMYEKYPELRDDEVMQQALLSAHVQSPFHSVN